MARISADDWDAERWPHFSVRELACQHCGRLSMEEEFLDDLETMRELIGPMRISSGYRCDGHPIEAAKETPGSHSKGIAVDVACRGQGAFMVLQAALDDGSMWGIGVSQQGESRFIHLDQLEADYRPSLWSY